MNWVDKYKPKKTGDIVGHSKEIELLRSCILGKKPVIMHGDTGVGKTSSIYAIGNELNFEILEVNASDKRNKEQVLEVIGNSAKQMSLFNRPKLILIDEVDGIAGNEDRGGIAAICEILGETSHAIVFTCNDLYNKKLATLRKKCTVISLKRLNYLSINKRLKDILKLEGIKFNEILINELAKRAQGDIRGAINDLQMLSLGGSVDELDIGDRMKKEQVFNVLKAIFKSKNYEEITTIVERMDIDLDELILWLDENLPYEYKRLDDIYLGYEKLSKGDIFNGRIRKRQYWRLLVYRSLLSSMGVSLSKKDVYREFFIYRRPGRILKMWMAKQKNNKKNLAAEKLGTSNHCSIRKARSELLPYVEILAKKGVIFDGIEF